MIGERVVLYKGCIGVPVIPLGGAHDLSWRLLHVLDVVDV